MGAAARHLAPTKRPTSATQFWPQVESARVLICVGTITQQRMVPCASVEKLGVPAAAPHSCISWTDKGQPLSPRSGADLFAGLQVGRLVCAACFMHLWQHRSAQKSTRMLSKFVPSNALNIDFSLLTIAFDKHPNAFGVVCGRPPCTGVSQLKTTPLGRMGPRVLRVPHWARSTTGSSTRWDIKTALGSWKTPR